MKFNKPTSGAVSELPEKAPPLRLVETPPPPDAVSGDDMSAEQFVAKLDLPLARKRFRSLLVEAEKNPADANEIADQYDELCNEWAVEELKDAHRREEVDRKRKLQARENLLRGVWGDVSDVDGDNDVFETAGRIKWFDASKGYGFISPDGGSPDILIHVACLRASNFQTAYEGARIHCLVLRRPRGLQAIRVLYLDNSTGICPSQEPVRTHLIVEPESDWERAQVKWINRVRGFGLLTRGDGTPDIFFHMETLRRYGFSELRPGQIVEIRYGQGARVPMLAEIRIPSASGKCSGAP